MHNTTNRYALLDETADRVRATIPANDARSSSSPLRRTLRRVLFGFFAVAIGIALAPSVQTAVADGTADDALFALTNQDRASNGVPALRWNTTLQGIAEATPYAVCGVTVLGRSQDMINRNYFAHPIPPCGVYVFTMMQAARIPYKSAGENIGWDSNITNPGASAAYINNAFMNSTEHRTNILDPRYTDVGIGSAFTPGPWTGSGQQSDAWMFSEEFAQLGSSNIAFPPAQPAAPTAPRNQPAPSTPQQPPVTTQAATPLPQPSLTPSPPASVEQIASQAPLIWQGSGFLSDAVESVLEGYLVN